MNDTYVKFENISSQNKFINNPHRSVTLAFKRGLPLLIGDTYICEVLI